MPEVKKRKKELAKARRELLQQFKQQDPSLYSKIRSGVFKPVERRQSTKKRKFETETATKQPRAKKQKVEFSITPEASTSLPNSAEKKPETIETDTSDSDTESSE